MVALFIYFIFFFSSKSGKEFNLWRKNWDKEGEGEEEGEEQGDKGVENTEIKTEEPEGLEIKTETQSEAAGTESESMEVQNEAPGPGSMDNNVQSGGQGEVGSVPNNEGQSSQETIVNGVSDPVDNSQANSMDQLDSTDNNSSQNQAGSSVDPQPVNSAPSVHPESNNVDSVSDGQAVVNNGTTEDLPIETPQSAPAPPVSSQGAPVPNQDAPVSTQSSTVPSQGAPVPSQSAPVPSQSAPVMTNGLHDYSANTATPEGPQPSTSQVSSCFTSLMQDRRRGRIS